MNRFNPTNLLIVGLLLSRLIFAQDSKPREKQLTVGSKPLRVTFKMSNFRIRHINTLLGPENKQTLAEKAHRVLKDEAPWLWKLKGEDGRIGVDYELVIELKRSDSATPTLSIEYKLSPNSKAPFSIGDVHGAVKATKNATYVLLDDPVILKKLVQTHIETCLVKNLYEWLGKDDDVRARGHARVYFSIVRDEKLYSFNPSEGKGANQHFVLPLTFDDVKKPTDPNELCLFRVFWLDSNSEWDSIDAQGLVPVKLSNLPPSLRKHSELDKKVEAKQKPNKPNKTIPNKSEGIECHVVYLGTPASRQCAKTWSIDDPDVAK